MRLGPFSTAISQCGSGNTRFNTGSGGCLRTEEHCFLSVAFLARPLRATRCSTKFRVLCVPQRQRICCVSPSQSLPNHATFVDFAITGLYSGTAGIQRLFRRIRPRIVNQMADAVPQLGMLLSHVVKNFMTRSILSWVTADSLLNWTTTPTYCPLPSL